MGQSAESVTGESDVTDTEGARDTTEESTVAEMAWCTVTTLMISTNGKKLHLSTLAREQDRAVTQALQGVQDLHTEDFKATASTTTYSQSIGCTVHLKCCSASHEEVVKRSRDESPETSGV